MHVLSRYRHPIEPSTEYTYHELNTGIFSTESSHMRSVLRVRQRGNSVWSKFQNSRKFHTSVCFLVHMREKIDVMECSRVLACTRVNTCSLIPRVSCPKSPKCKMSPHTQSIFETKFFRVCTFPSDPKLKFVGPRTNANRKGKKLRHLACIASRNTRNSV